MGLQTFLLQLTDEYDYLIYMRKDFWHKLTGDENFYSELIHAIREVAIEASFSEDLKDVIVELSKSPEIQNLSKSNISN